MTTLLIDADGVAFRAASAVEKGIAWDDDIFTSHADLNDAKEVFQDQIEKMCKATDASAKVILCYSCPTRRYFRHDIFPSYKSHRKDRPPLVLRELKEWSMKQYEFNTKPGLEADDVMGVLATLPKFDRPIIVSDDKDMLQIPGEHLSASNPADGVYRVNPDFASRQLWLQVLTGDQTDGYPGLPGCGPVTAVKILDGADGDFEAAVLAAYEKKKLTAEDMAVQVNVARILTAQTYDFKKKAPIAWTSTKR